jgi:transcriptional regulator
MPAQTLGLVQGTVDVLILRALTRDTLHGYAISLWIKDRSDGVLAVEDAALYQALHRLERQGWVEAEWGISDTGRKARFYQLTPSGRKQLKSDEAELRRYVAALFAVLAPS